MFGTAVISFYTVDVRCCRLEEGKEEVRSSLLGLVIPAAPTPLVHPATGRYSGGAYCAFQPFPTSPLSSPSPHTSVGKSRLFVELKSELGFGKESISTTGIRPVPEVEI